MKLRFLILCLLLGFLAGCATAFVYAQSTCGVVQERFRYERRQKPDSGPFYYVEIYETRQQDCDSSAITTTNRIVTAIPDRPTKVAQMNAERQSFVVAAQQLQQRINDLNALP